MAQTIAQKLEAHRLRRLRAIANDPEKVRQDDHNKYIKHRERSLAQKKIYYAATKEEKKIYQKQYREANKEKLAAQHKEYYYANHQKMLDRAREYVKSNKSKIISSRRERSYGISQSAYLSMLDAQGGTCAICKTSAFGIKGPCVDHDHITGQVRGILCNNCNRAIGLLKENIFILKAAINYLRKANVFNEKDLPGSLREMCERQSERDAIARGARPN